MPNQDCSAKSQRSKPQKRKLELNHNDSRYNEIPQIGQEMNFIALDKDSSEEDDINYVFNMNNCRRHSEM